MGAEIPLEIRFRAEEMYVVDGLTYDQVAEASGVSVTQLKRWGADSDWGERRSEYRTALSSIRRDTVLLRQKLIEKAMNSLDPQAVYAVARMEAAAAKAVKPDPDAVLSSVDPKIIKTPEDAVGALSEVIERKLNTLLSQPGAISLAAIKDVKQAMELVEKMREKYIADDSGYQKKIEVDPETLRVIKEDIYGI